ncbi:MAG: 23S rRNA (uracil(1939)-C(5))-methyltransferase RlmD [bacterium]
MNNIKIDDEIIVDVKRLGINGEGIAYYLRKTVFIDNALPDETVLIKITNETPTFLNGEIIKFIKQSPNRVRPFCPYFNECGGCQIQHLDYKHSKIVKRDMLIETIRKYSNLNPRTFQINETVIMDNPKNYRNKSQMAVCSNGNELIQALYKQNSRDYVRINTCPIQNESINATNAKVLKILEAFGIESIDNEGILKNIATRISTSTNKLQVTLIVKKDDSRLEKAAKEIKSIQNVESVYKSINNSDTNMFGNLIKLEGQDTITETIGTFKFNLLPTSFFQLNPIQTNKLYETVKKLCKLSFKETVIDAYCGVGTIGMYLAKNAKNVIGIEINEDAITNAIENAKLNKIKNIEFIAGDATLVIPNLINEGVNPDIMVFDPPRTGLTKEIRDIVKTTLPKRIVYVSCNPSTLAKDLKELSQNYKVKSITPFDMFPFTSHIESVTLLELK